MRLLLVATLVSAVAVAPVQSQGAKSDVERAAGPREKMICKRFTRTGTLAGVDRICRTRHEWELERANLRQLEQIDSCRTRGTNGVGC